jgi:uncharacterized repeat protein (TIGR01451 family)
MNVFDTLFPRRMQPRKELSQSRAVSARRNRLRDLEQAERLEDRLALAVVTPFAVAYTTNAIGDITFASNTLMTAPGNSQAAVNARNGVGSNLNNDDWDMAYVDIDGDASTFNSSSAQLVLPAGADVLFAGLYWGARTNSNVSDSVLQAVKFKRPGDAGYTDITGAVVGKVVGGVSNLPANVQTYGAFEDVTSLVQATGAGTYTMANVRGDPGNINHFAGWSLVVAYEAPSEVARNLTVFNGFAAVSNNSAADRNVTVPFTGFIAPPSGDVNATLGFVTYEGDLGITGDSAFLEGGQGETQLSNATNPANNFFNSSITNRGVTVTTKTPNYLNQLGFDADLVATTNIIANGATSAQVRLTSTQDQYYPGVITTNIELYAPKVTVQKSVTDLNGGEVIAGDQLRYTVTVSNAGNALDAAANVILQDVIPANTTYQPGTLVITAGANAGPKTDASGDDQAEFDSIGNQVQFQLGTGATAFQGGTLAAGATTTMTFDVTVNPDVAVETLIRNKAVSTFVAETSRFQFSAKSADVDVVCRPSGDLAILKTNGQTTVVAGDPLIYTITVTNTGPSTATNALVADTFPGDLQNVTWTAAYAGGASGAPNGVGNISTLVTVPKNGTAVFTVTGTINPATSATTLVNTATVTPPANFIDRNPANNSSTDTDTLVRQGDLAVTKTDGQGTAVPGDPLTYTIVVTNTGPSTATNAVVADLIPTDIVGVTWAATYAGGATGPANGIGNLNAVVTLPKNATITFTVNGTIKASATGTLVNTVTVTPPANFTDLNPANNTATDRTQLEPTGDLSILKTDGKVSAIPGTPETYTILVTNPGPSDVVGAIINDTFPAALLNPTWTVSYSVGSSGPLLGVGNISGVLVNLLAGGTATFTVSGTIDPLATGTLVNTATVTPPEGFTDPNPGNNTSTDETALVPTTDLSVVKTLSSAPPVVAGSPLTYTITVTNLGPSSIESFTVTDVSTPALLSPVYLVSTGSYDPLTGIWTATPGDSFATGETVIFTLTGTVPAGATGSQVNTATALPPAGVVDPDLGNNTSTVTDPISSLVNLAITKTDGTDTYKSGGTTTYTIVLTNKGPANATGVTVIDVLPPQLDLATTTWFASYVNSSGTLPTTPTTGNISGTVSLQAVTGTVTITINANILTTALGDMINTVTATPPQGTGEPVSATDINAFDGPINPTADIRALVTGSDDGCNGLPLVRVLDPETGAPLSEFLAYESSFRGSVRVATGDVTGDGIPEIIVAPGRNRVGQIRVFGPNPAGSTNYSELFAYRTLPFGAAYRGGVEVTVGDLDGDGVGDIIAGQSSGAGLVRTFLVNPNAVDPVANVPSRSFRGIPGPYAGGVMVAAGDFGTFVNGAKTSTSPDGIAEIAVGSNAGIKATVRVFDVSGAPKVVRTLQPIGANFKGGVTLSTAKYSSDAIDDIFVGAGVGGSSIVEIYDGDTGTNLAKLSAFSSFTKQNARVFTAALDSIANPGIVENIYGVKGLNGGAGAKGVRAYNRSTSQTATLPASTFLAPPLRIAPIIVRVTG